MDLNTNPDDTNKKHLFRFPVKLKTLIRYTVIILTLDVISTTKKLYFKIYLFCIYFL